MMRIMKSTKKRIINHEIEDDGWSVSWGGGGSSGSLNETPTPLVPRGLHFEVKNVCLCCLRISVKRMNILKMTSTNLSKRQA